MLDTHLDRVVDEVDRPQRRTRVVSHHQFVSLKLVIEAEPIAIVSCQPALCPSSTHTMLFTSAWLGSTNE
jgi:hypothetical protein